MASHTFPLYRLPIVALAVVFNCMNPNKVFWLSLVSKKSSRITKALVKKTGLLSLTIDTVDCMSISFDDIYHELFCFEYNQEHDEDCVHEHLKIGNTVVIVEKWNEEDKRLFMNCDNNRFYLITTLFEHVTNLFGQSLFYLGIYDLNIFNESRRLFEWVLNRKESIPEVSFCDPKSDDEKFTYFLNTLGNRVTDELLMRRVTTTKNFQYIFQQALTAKTIHWTNATWMTLNNLYAMQCRSLLIEEINLTSEDINTFLKNWIKGGNLELRDMNLTLPPINNEVMFTDLAFTQKNYPNNMSYTTADNETHTFSRSFDLKRKDGTMASIILDSEGNREFFMVVWPDSKGNLYPVQQDEK